MKSIVKYIIVSLFVLLQTSCNDWLTLLPPNGLVREEFWKTKEDVQSSLMAVYSSFAVLDDRLFLFGELRADMIRQGTTRNTNEQAIIEGNIDPDNTLTDWKDFYKVISNANLVLKNAPLVQKVDKTFTDFQLQQILSEAIFMRSLTYFYLVRFYKDVPLVLEPSEDDRAKFYYEKSSDTEVLAQIVADLKAYRDFAPSGGFLTVEENKGFASKAAFDALLADIALWRFDYPEVLVQVEKIEADKDIILMPSLNWFEIFNPGNTFEGIFEIQYDPLLGQSNKIYGLTSATTTSSRYLLSEKAIERFSFLTSFEITRGELATAAPISLTSYKIWKYAGLLPDGVNSRSGTSAGGANLIIYRLADVLLMKAEALAMLDRYDESLAVINIIRDRARIAPITLPNTQVAFEDAIMEERALELAYEGKRWFDLLRLGRRNNFARKDQLIEIIVSNVPAVQKRILSARLANPLGWYLPIYTKEVENNMNLVQNPFYIN